MLFFVFFMQNFKREEQNFVVQNEINNLGFLTGECKTKMSKVKTEDKAHTRRPYIQHYTHPKIISFLIYI